MSDVNLLNLFFSLDDSSDIRENQVSRAPLGYPGCKEKSADEILPRLPHRNAYIEPFGGSGIVLFKRKESNLEVYNDKYGGITCFYKCLQHPKKHRELIDRLQFVVHSREMFVWARDTWDSQDIYDDVDRAVRWWLMHQMSFAKKEKTFGRSTSGRNQTGSALRNNLQWFEPVHRRLTNVIIENQDWRQIVKDFDRDDAVFVFDPTYLGCTRSIYKHEMTKIEHVELCERAMRMKGFVALCGFDNEATKDVYDRYDWDEIHVWEVDTQMAGLAFTEENNLAGKEGQIKRGAARESLWIRDNAKSR